MQSGEGRTDVSLRSAQLAPAATRLGSFPSMAAAGEPGNGFNGKSSHPPRRPAFPPKSLMLPGEPAGGDAHDLLRVGDGGADRLRHPAVSFEDRERALGGGGVDHVAEADAHIEDLEHLAVVDAGVALDEGKDGMRLDEPVDLVADGGGDAGEVEQAVAGDVDQRLHPGHLRQDLHRLGNVDVGRAQELFPERHGKLVELVADGVAVVGEERLAREREAVAVDAAASDADDDVAFAHAAPVDDLVEGNAAHRHPHQVEMRDHVLELRGLAARNRDARDLGALAQAGGDGVEHGGVGLCHRDVVDHRERLGADADHVVDVHGDAVDADGVVFAHHVGDDGLRADAVGAERKPDAVELDHVGEIADRQHHAAEPRRRPGGLYPRDDAVQARIRLRGVDAALAVDFIAHVGFSACCAGAALAGAGKGYHVRAFARHLRFPA